MKVDKYLKVKKLRSLSRATYLVDNEGWDFISIDLHRWDGEQRQHYDVIWIGKPKPKRRE